MHLYFKELNDTERRYTVQEKEMTAVVHCLRVWRHYPLGSQFLVKTSNVATSYFQTQKKLSPKQVAGLSFRVLYDLGAQAWPGGCRCETTELMALRVVPATSESRVEGTIVSHIREGLEKDPLAKSILRLVEEGKTPRFWVKDGLLMTKGRRMYVPKVGELTKTLLHECNDTPWAGHPGWHRTLALLERRYYWPNMRDEV